MFYYKHQKPRRDAALALELRELSQKYPRWGYRLIRNKLKDRVSYGRVHRIWRSEGLSLPRRRKSKRLRGKKHRWMSAIAPNGIWAYDFIFDACANGQTLKCLTIVDEWTRECLAIVPAGRIRSTELINVLSRLVTSTDLLHLFEVTMGRSLLLSQFKPGSETKGLQLLILSQEDPGRTAVSKVSTRDFERTV
jgi:putative transposase